MIMEHWEIIDLVVAIILCVLLVYMGARGMNKATSARDEDGIGGMDQERLDAIMRAEHKTARNTIENSEVPPR